MSRYNKLYRDRRRLDWLGMGHDTINCIVTGEGLATGSECRDTKSCIVTGRRFGRWLCRDTAQPDAAIRPQQRPRYGQAGVRHGAARLRHGWPQTATRPVLGHDTAPLCTTIRGGVHDMGAPYAQPGFVGCAPLHPTQFWTQCTVSESLFGTLFMSTVHKFFSKKK